MLRAVFRLALHQTERLVGSFIRRGTPTEAVASGCRLRVLLPTGDGAGERPLSWFSSPTAPRQP